ncbi:hypothetical protein IFM89_038058 [Coptis chinensis]|uniref:Sister chromatid cohesion protein PDS5 homolog A n=1 Tax=Coptis chinensis TaxID=261450 RepID=A0A835H210_9MAGN|nr:hypothetical protein IFM89_038058 [Coptis chinensis]
MAQKAQKLRKELRDIGTKLEKLPTSKDSLLKLLKQAATCLSDLDQSPSPSMLGSMQPFLNAIVNPELLKHQDRDVKLLAATCICEITRITAPEAPYSDDVLRDIFHLIVGTFCGLGDTTSPSFGRRVVILETLARYRSCIVMLDLECDDLVNEMFSTFFAVASVDHPETVLTSMQTIMVLLLEESEDILENLLLILLTVLGGTESDVSVAARRLAMNVIAQCAGKLESYIKQYLISSMSGDNKYLNSKLDYHEVIYNTYRCAPQILSGVLPYLTGELLADQLDTRLKAVKLLGNLFALPDPIIEAFQPIFSELLKRLTDRVVEVRMSVVDHMKTCLISDPCRVEAPQIIASLCDRLLDYNENVRKLVVAALCDVVCSSLKSIGVDTLKLVAERLRDKSVLVKRYTMERIAEIYRLYCLRGSDGSISPSGFEWIPAKILRCLYDKDFRSETIEVMLCSSLFPMESRIIDKVKHWVTIFSGCDKVEVKALEKILEQKQRLQLEMQKYLSLRPMHQEGEASDFQKKIMHSFRIMSRCFLDPEKAEENFQILDHLKDANVWKILTKLLDPNTNFLQAWTCREDLLKIVGEQHPLFDFLGILSMKCSYLLFDKECVKEMLLEVAAQKSTGDTQFVLSSLNLLVIIARFSPILLLGTEAELVKFLKEDDNILKEGALQILARAGGTIREQLATASSSVDLILERLCVEGSRKQAKYAVQALAAVTKDDGLKSLSVLYKRLVDMLVEKTHLPSILQSLGCIAQIAMSIFETRENEIADFITSNILHSSNKAEDNSKTGWDERSELCLLKIFAMKTLVKSYLPVKDAHLRVGFENFLRIIKNILSIGEVADHVESSAVDKAYMKLASGKAVLRLSKLWDHKIPVEVFHLTLRISEVIYPEARKEFLGKVHQYMKDRLLDVKYACAFLFTTNGTQPPEFDEYKHNLVDVIQMCYQAKTRQLPMYCEANLLMTYPEFILPYLVHALAHHSSCPNIDKCTDVGAFETIYRQLHLFLYSLVHVNEDVKPEVGNKKEMEIVSAIVSIFQSIKCSEDIVDVMKSKNSHAICDLGLSIAKHLSQKQVDSIGLTSLVPLPLTLYKQREKKEEDNSVAHVEQTWLASDSVLAHFEALKLETYTTVCFTPKDVSVAEDSQLPDDSDRDENEPLGQMIKKLKSQGSKTKKAGKKKILLSKRNDVENDFDILGMVREINLDGLEGSNTLGSRNGHEYTVGGKTDGQHIDENKLLSRKRKVGKTGKSTSLASSKYEEVSSGQDIHKSSRSSSYIKGMKRASKCYPHNAEPPSHADATDKISIEEDFKPIERDLHASHVMSRSFSMKQKSKRTGHNYNDTAQLIGEAAGTELKIPSVQLGDDKDDSDTKSSIGSIKKKGISVTGLEKCSMKEGESLVGFRIKVWWPLDKKFYEGLVQAYDQGKKKHEILYDDGEMEVLCLAKERWELINNDHIPRKRQKSLIDSPTNGVETEQIQNNLTPTSLRHNKKSKKSSSSKGGRKGSAKSSDLGDDMAIRCETEGNAISDLSNCDTIAVSKVDDMNSGDSERKQMEELDKFLTDTNNNNKKERKQVGNVKLNKQISVESKKHESALERNDLNAERTGADAQECDKEESKSEERGVNETVEWFSGRDESKVKHPEVNETDITQRKTCKKKSDSANSPDNEDSDAEPLVLTFCPALFIFKKVTFI